MSQIIVPVLLSNTVVRFPVYLFVRGSRFIYLLPLLFFLFSYRFLLGSVFSLEIVHILDKKTDLFSVMCFQLVISESK